MWVAVALFGEEISPRFDCCGALAFVDSEQGFETAEVIHFNNPDGEKRLGLLLERNAQVLLCGGIRRCDWFRLQAQGIEVFSGLQGQASDCFKDYREGRLQPEASTNTPSFGCQRRQHRHGKGD
jgi:predicted Fe-Mo cluster-binding NifX family protein